MSETTHNPRQPSNRLSFEDAIEVWLHHWKGEFQNRIASLFDVNPARINEIIKGKLHPGSKEAALKKKR